MKTISLTLSMLFILVTIHAQDLKQIKKNIPLRKVSNIVVSPVNSNWFTFDYKVGKGLWDNEKGKVIHTSEQAFHFFSTQHKNVYVVYGGDYTGYYLLKENKNYVLTLSDTSYDSRLKGRYEIDYREDDNELSFYDTITKESFYLSRSNKDILLKYINRESKIRDTKIIDLATNKIALEINAGYLSRIKMGYLQKIDAVTIFYDSSYNKLTEGLSGRDIHNFDKLSEVVGCKIDSIGYSIYGGYIFGCNGKYGSFSLYNGLILDPIYTVIADIEKAAILVADKKIGAYVGITNTLISPAYSNLVSYHMGSGLTYIKMDERLFTGIFSETIYFQDFREIKMMDTLDFSYENREALATNINGNLVISNGFNVYHDSGDEAGEDWKSWYVFEGTSGIYNYESAKWEVTPDKYLVYPYGNHYFVGDQYKDGENGNFYFIDSTFEKINDQVFINYQYLGNQLFVFDSNYVWYMVNENPFHVTTIGEVLKGDKIHKDGAYYMIGREEEYNGVLNLGVVDENLKLLKNPKEGWYKSILINDFAIIRTEMDEFGDYNYALYDMLNEKVISKWSPVFEKKGDKKIDFGYQGEVLLYDLTTIRNK